MEHLFAPLDDDADIGVPDIPEPALPKNLADMWAAHPLLSAEREAALWQRRDEPAAREEILTAHMPLCRSLAARHAYTHKCDKARQDDYFGVALLAMTVAYDKFKYPNETHARFNSFVMKHIKYELLDHDIRLSSPVRLSSNNTDRLLVSNWAACNDIALAENRHQTNFARQVRIAALMKEKFPHREFKAEDIAHYEGRYQSRDFSLNKKAYPQNGRPDQGTEAVDFLVSPYGTVEDHMEEQDKQALMQAMKEAVSQLDPRAQDILYNRLLCEDDEALSLAELGEKHNVTSERIRQLEIKALKDLRRLMAVPEPIAKPIAKPKPATQSTGKPGRPRASAAPAP